MFAGYASLWTQPLGLDRGPKAQARDARRSAAAASAPPLRDMWLQQLQQPLTFLSGLPDMAKAIGGIVAKLAEPGAVGSLGDMFAPRRRSTNKSRPSAVSPASRFRCRARKRWRRLRAASSTTWCWRSRAGMLRRHLAEDQAAAGQTLRAAVPISLREAGARAGEQSGVRHVLLLASDIEDPKARLAKIIEESKKSKSLARSVQAAGAEAHAILGARRADDDPDSVAALQPQQSFRITCPCRPT